MQLASFTKPWVRFQVQNCKNAEILLTAEPFTETEAIHVRSFLFFFLFLATLSFTYLELVADSPIHSAMCIIW